MENFYSNSEGVHTVLEDGTIYTQSLIDYNYRTRELMERKGFVNLFELELIGTFWKQMARGILNGTCSIRVRKKRMAEQVLAVHNRAEKARE